MGNKWENIIIEKSERLKDKDIQQIIVILVKSKDHNLVNGGIEKLLNYILQLEDV